MDTVKRLCVALFIAPLLWVSAFAQVTPSVPQTTSTQVLSAYPASKNGGRSANTSDMGFMTSDGIRWLSTSTPPIPIGAAILGYTRNVYTIFPVVGDISFSVGANKTRFYSGFGPFSNIPPSSAYTTATNGQLQLHYPNGGPAINASLITTQNAVNSQQLSGNLEYLPYLVGSYGFCVEEAITESTNVTDNWFAFFLMPQEHNTIQLDHQPGDPTGYERWMEFDINENGHGTDLSGAYRGDWIKWFGPFAGALVFTANPTGNSGTLAVSAMTNGSGQWQGDTSATWTIKFASGATRTATLTNGSSSVTWTGGALSESATNATVGYNRTTSSNTVVTPLDYTSEHIFTMCYDPNGNTVTWYQDQVAQNTISTASADAITKTWHYFPILYMQSRGANVGFTTNVRYIAAWTP